jgi:ParB family chromosome partitioning protein
MSKGGVTSWGSLVDDVGKNSTVDGRRANRAGTVTAGRSVPLTDLVPNPYNPRDSIGDLAELASIVDHQLQPAVVVTRTAFQALFPDAAVAGKWVVIIGNRRLAAAEKFGRPHLDIVVKDDLARDRATLLGAVISENVDRQAFDVIEEAKAVEQLVAASGSAQGAGEALKKSETWISQRRALLRLDPALQNALRRGELPIRDARELAKMPPADQIHTWQARSGATAGGGAGAHSRPPNASATGATPASPRTRSLSRALRRFDTEPNALALALYEELGSGGAKTLIGLLRKQLNT